MNANDTLRRDHGYCFEVPALAEGLADPVPLVGLGRFRHEAVAIEPVSGCVYLTEDMFDGLLYRFVPEVPGELAKGGKLQALRVRGAGSLDTRNWHDFTRIPVGEEIDVEWVDLEDPDSPEDDLRHRGFLQGAARFARGEGIAFGNDSIYFCCTNGGRAKKGQVWRYVPSKYEGTRRERMKRAKLSLFVEPNDETVMDACDNLCVAPWGHLVLCEDGNGTDQLLGVTAAGEIYVIGRNAGSHSELAGATFSPDGTTLFVNVQTSGLTLALTGPWERAKAV